MNGDNKEKMLIDVKITTEKIMKEQQDMKKIQKEIIKEQQEMKKEQQEMKKEQQEMKKEQQEMKKEQQEMKKEQQEMKKEQQEMKKEQQEMKKEQQKMNEELRRLGNIVTVMEHEHSKKLDLILEVLIGHTEKLEEFEKRFEKDEKILETYGHRIYGIEQKLESV